MLCPVSMTPLGRPVVPPVPTSMAMSSRGSACQGSAGSEPIHRSNGVAFGGSPSRQTRVVSFGRSGRILATSGAKAAWKIRHVQSKKSSRSRFSAASLRGLTGHHTAPAREMPNTQLKAIGSFADKIATLLPGAIPLRSRARATRQDSRWTSK